MSRIIDNLVIKCQTLEPLDGRVLVHPLKLRTYESVTKEPDMEAVKAAKLNPMEDEIPHEMMKQKIYDINHTYQRAIVLQVAKNEQKLVVGDTIIYKVSNLNDFDLIKGVSVLKNFEVIAIERITNLKVV
jgi:hypothetical protein